MENGLLSWNYNRFPPAALAVGGHLAAKPRHNSQQSVNPIRRKGSGSSSAKTGRLVNAAKGAQLVFQFQAAVAPEANCGEQIKILHNPFASFGCLCRKNRPSGHIEI